MTESPHTFDCSQLGAAERILLAQELWESVLQQAEALPITDAQKQELERRWKACQAGETTASSWSKVKRRLLDR